ncbi:MAG: hypothetical protein DWI59_06620, partial [Chloroflexi bacterium]
TQSRVLDEKAKGMGATVAWRQAFTHMLNEFVFGEYVNFYFIEKDYRDQRAAQEVTSARANYIASIIQAGIITPQQGLQLLVDAKDLPRDFLPKDMTVTEVYGDNERADVPFPYAEIKPEIQTAAAEGEGAAPLEGEGAPVADAAIPMDEDPNDAMQRGIDSLMADTEEAVAEEAEEEEDAEEVEDGDTTVSSSDKSGAVFDENGKPDKRKTKSYLSKKELSDKAGNPELEANAFAEHMQEVRLQFLAKLPATIKRG